MRGDGKWLLACAENLVCAMAARVLDYYMCGGVCVRLPLLSCAAVCVMCVCVIAWRLWCAHRVCMAYLSVVWF